MIMKGIGQRGDIRLVTKSEEQVRVMKNREGN